MARFVPALCLASALAVIIGCGGSEALGRNSIINVFLVSNSIADLSLIISPLQGGPNEPDACTESNPGFGCAAFLGSDTTEYEFTTNSLASSSPYHGYVRNFATGTRRFTLEVDVDDSNQWSRGYEIFNSETLYLVRIFRNSVGGPAILRSVGGEWREVKPILFKTKAERDAWLAQSPKNLR
jgi:hypothetical protein